MRIIMLCLFLLALSIPAWAVGSIDRSANDEFATEFAAMNKCTFAVDCHCQGDAFVCDTSHESVSMGRVYPYAKKEIEVKVRIGDLPKCTATDVTITLPIEIDFPEMFKMHFKEKIK